MDDSRDSVASAKLRRTVLYSGRVQGVGFRYTTCEIARRFDVAGYVRNLPDGRVELVAEGAPDELGRFQREIATALERNIHKAVVMDGEARGDMTGFGIRH